MPRLVRKVNQYKSGGARRVPGRRVGKGDGVCCPQKCVLHPFRHTAEGWKLCDLRVEYEMLIEVYRTETG